MSLAYRNRKLIYDGTKRVPPRPIRVYRTLSFRFPFVTLSVQYRGLTWNTRRGWVSARTGIKGLTWQDRD
jgi:hypothetical protein